VSVPKAVLPEGNVTLKEREGDNEESMKLKCKKRAILSNMRMKRGK